ncbi:MAG: hypothetical protein ACRDDH_14700 [Cetobacterium sp.]|uniref:hypothetical protein n=1 Tax=Cetobacterium sp. TaxID=2071632 RepID=UPI003EE6455D
MIQVISCYDGITDGVFESKEKFFEYLKEQNVTFEKDGELDYYDLYYNGMNIDNVHFRELNINESNIINEYKSKGE